MAAIGKIRSWGPVLATVIGLALFAFIAEEMFRSCEATNNEKRQQVGEVLFCSGLPESCRRVPRGHQDDSGS